MFETGEGCVGKKVSRVGAQPSKPGDWFTTHQREGCRKSQACEGGVGCRCPRTAQAVGVFTSKMPKGLWPRPLPELQRRMSQVVHTAHTAPWGSEDA